MGPTSYVSFPVPHKVSFELQPHFQADLKKFHFFTIQDAFLEALKLHFCKIVLL